MSLIRCGMGSGITKATKVTSSFPYTIQEDGVYVIYIGCARPSTYEGDPEINTGGADVIMDSKNIWVSSDGGVCGNGRTKIIKAKAGTTISLTLHNWSIGTSGRNGISKLE